MTSQTRTLARPYAKAVFEMAKNYQSFEEWKKMLTVLSMVAKDKRVINVIRNPGIVREKTLMLFLSVCEPVLNPLGENLVRLLAAHKRLEILPEIATLFDEMRNEAENKLEAKLVSAVPLSAEEKEALRLSLESYLEKTLKFSYEVDHGLIGGFVAYAKDTMIDSSILGQLAQMKEAMGG